MGRNIIANNKVSTFMSANQPFFINFCLLVMTLLWKDEEGVAKTNWFCIHKFGGYLQEE